MSIDTPPLLISHVSHRYPNAENDALLEVSFTLHPDEILCLVGPSGCGKSTLLRLIAGLERVQSGDISMHGALMGSPALHRLPEKRHVGLVFQDFALFPHLSIIDNVAFGLEALPKALRREKAAAMLKRVGLQDRADDMPHCLSGGQQQRVALARAIATAPRLLLLDEPFSNLDIRLRHRMRMETLHLLKENRIPSIMVTHDPDDAMFMADRIALLYAGEVVQMGTPAELYHAPVSPFAAEFFGEVNRLSGRVDDGCVETPLGRVDAGRLATGTPVDILIRPEAIELSLEPHSEACAVTIDAIHPLGANTLIECHSSGLDTALFLQINLPSRAASRLSHKNVYASLNPEREGVYVFSVGNTSPKA